MAIVVGITGSIACGKSYVSSYLKKQGYVIIDTDKISHDITMPGEVGFLKIQENFKEVIINDVLDRKKLASIIFNNKEKKELLNSILHPLIYEECKKLIKASLCDIIFLDVPLLFEAHFDSLCDASICVYTDEDIQLKRLIERDKISKEDALKRISSQIPIKEKIKLSNFQIKSEEDFNLTNQNIEKVIKKIKEEYYA